jgi:hypothetical protein
MARVTPQPGGHLRAEWDAVSGKSYQLEYAAGDLAMPNLVFSNINTTVTAAGENAETVITNGAAQPMGVFRVRLVE